MSMKDQWIINPLNWYYKFSKSIVISVFYPFLLLLLSTQSLRRLCQTSRHLTLQPGRTDSVHVRPTPCLRGLNNLSNLRLYDTDLDDVLRYSSVRSKGKQWLKSIGRIFRDLSPRKRTELPEKSSALPSQKFFLKNL